jgi:hypothetical protein
VKSVFLQVNPGEEPILLQVIPGFCPRGKKFALMGGGIRAGLRTFNRFSGEELTIKGKMGGIIKWVATAAIVIACHLHDAAFADSSKRLALLKFFLIPGGDLFLRGSALKEEFRYF